MTGQAGIAESQNNLVVKGQAHLQADRLAEAQGIANRLLTAFADTAEALFFAGEVSFARSNYGEADRLAKKCIELFPEDLNGQVFRCRTLSALGHGPDALQQALSLADQDLTDPSHFHILITLLLGSGRADIAYPLTRKFVALDPENPGANRRLALTCRVIGNLDEAGEAADVVIKADPHDYEIVALRSDVRRATHEHNNIAELEALRAGGCRDRHGEVRVAFALARELEEVGEYRQSFEVLSAGAALRRSQFDYALADDLRPFEAFNLAFTEQTVSGATKGCHSEEPIFVLGLPRTGSTLVERILSSHSKVFAAGELPHFSTAMAEAMQRACPATSSLEKIQKAMMGDMDMLGRRYIALSRPFTGHTPHFIDKLPPNFVHLGFICLALPGAKIIHIRRTPLDACFAMYKFLFDKAYPWSYDLGDIAAYYIAYRRLMDHWRKVFPDRIIDIAYENVVEDLEGESRGLIAALGLEWEPACLEFEKNEAVALTGSASQVREKIYSSSVGRWKDYKEQLKPVAKALEAAGIDPYAP